jgi:5'-nucleotidase (lipoprotein e(P4) family)
VASTATLTDRIHHEEMRTMNLVNQVRVRRLWLGVLLAALAYSPATIAQTAAPAPECTPPLNEYQAGAILWTQTSGEARALAYQAFTLARMVLDQDLRVRRRGGQRRAVVVDVDETVLDNSRYQATLLKNRQPYNSNTWTDWVKLEQAEAIPGAVEFLRYASSRGVRVFYVTNRKQVEKDATAANLRKLGFPDVSDQTLRVKTDPKSSSKQPRRNDIDRQYRIVLLMGDNLNDFAEVFENGRTVTDRLAAVEQNKGQFGTRFIVLPNVMYGDWESAVYDYNLGLEEDVKAAKRRGLLRTIEPK